MVTDRVLVDTFEVGHNLDKASASVLEGFGSKVDAKPKFECPFSTTGWRKAFRPASRRIVTYFRKIDSFPIYDRASEISPA